MTARPFTFRDSILTHDFGRRSYEESLNLILGTKFGQRKLFFALLQFLTYYCQPSYVPREKYVVVYAGAAHGNNIAFASKLRPDVEFHLYDPADFKIEEVPGKIKIYNIKFSETNTGNKEGFFTSEEAEWWRDYNKKHKNVFFMSDIRIVDSEMDEIAQEYQIQKDMDMQGDWVKTIRPVYSQLKFRLPFKSMRGQLVSLQYREYLPGVVYFGFWTGVSVETRLVTSAKESQQTVAWDVHRYEENLAYFNGVYRTMSWKIDLGDKTYYSSIKDSELIDDYDSMAEVFIWKSYISLIAGAEKVTEEKIARLSNALTAALGNRKIQKLRDISRREFAPV